MGRNALKVMIATALFGALHSALASRAVKDAASAAVGRRGYREFFVIQSLASAGALAAFVLSLPRQTLYRVRGTAAGLMRLGQLAGLLCLVDGLRRVGIANFVGIREPVPEAQGPRPDADGRIRAAGAFALSRHPLNFFGLPILWLAPTMTANLAAFALATTLYTLAGSRHEEKRLASAYGAAYRAYRESGVPFFIPGRERRDRLPGA